MSLTQSVKVGLSTAVAMPSIYVGTCFGTLFTPALTAAAGGTAAIIGATAAGLEVAFIPTIFFSSMAALTNNPIPKIGFSILAAASFLGGMAFGGALFNLSAGSLLPSVAIGVAIAALGLLATVGLAKICLNSFIEETKQAFMPKPSTP